MDMSELADQQELIYISSMWTQDVVWKIYLEWCMIGMNGESESGKSMLVVWLDDEKLILYDVIDSQHEKYPNQVLKIII